MIAVQSIWELSEKTYQNWLLPGNLKTSLSIYLHPNLHDTCTHTPKGVSLSYGCKVLMLWPCPTLGLIRSLWLHRNSAAQLQSLTTYSGHARADNLPLSTTLGLCSIRSLPHLAVYPALTWVLCELDMFYTLYHFLQTWFILHGPDFIFTGPDLVLTPVIPCPPFRMFTCHRKYLTLVCT